MQPIYGRLSDIFGRKVVLLASLVIFWFGSLACALAQVSVAPVLNQDEADAVILEHDPIDRIPSTTRHWRWRCLDPRNDHHLRRRLAQRARQIPGYNRCRCCFVQQYRPNHWWSLDGKSFMALVFREFIPYTEAAKGDR